VLKIEKNQSDLDFDGLCKDYFFPRALEDISRNTLQKIQNFKNGKLEVYGYPDFIVYTCSSMYNDPSFEVGSNFDYGVKILKILLTKYGGINSSFSIYVSENHKPYNIIGGQTPLIFHSMPKDQIKNDDKYLLDNTSTMEKQKPIPFPIFGNNAEKAFSSYQSCLNNN